MIPTQLERLILCEKAVFKTVAVGRSGVCVLPVEEKRFIVITNFTYFNFIDFTSPDDIFANLDRSVHQLNFSSPKSQNHFIIRDDLHIITGPGPVELTCPHGHYAEENLYLVHESDVTVEIIAAPEVAATVSTGGIPPNRLKTPDPPVSYGTDPATAIPSTISEAFGATGEYQPLTRKFSPPSALTPFLVGSLRYPVNAATALNPTFTGNGSGQRSYPIVNIGYVEVRRQLGAELLSTG